MIKKRHISDGKLNYCDWSKCSVKDYCVLRAEGTDCYTLHVGAQPNIFDDYICYLEVGE